MATQCGTVAPDVREAAPFETWDAPALLGDPFMPSGAQLGEILNSHGGSERVRCDFVKYASNSTPWKSTKIDYSGLGLY